MLASRSAVLLLAGLALLAGAPLLHADPGERHPQALHGAPGGHGHPGGRGHKARDEWHGERRGHPHGAREERRGAERGGYIAVDDARVRVVIGDSRDYWNPGPALPPGIRKNLQRGKPLPPGIVRHWLDRRLERRLPYYAGHEWVRAGNDLLLISISTGLINVVLYDIFH